MQEDEGNYKRPPYKRYVIAGVLFLFIVGISILWVFNTDKGFWASTFSIVLVCLGVIFALFQWLLPISTETNVKLTSDEGKGTSVKSSQKPPKEFRVPVLVDIEGVDLEVTNKQGALVVYTNDSLRGKSLEVFHAYSFRGGYSNWGSANVNKRTKNGEDVFVAVFPRLPGGDYFVSEPINHGGVSVQVLAGQVSEVDWNVPNLTFETRMFNG